MLTVRSSPKRLAQGSLAAALLLAAACAGLPASYPAGSRRPSPALPPPSRPRDGLRADPSRLDFGGLAAGETAVLQVEVWNGSERGVHLRQAVVDGGDFFIREDGCSGKLLLPGRGCFLAVGFSPSGGGASSGSLLIVPDDPYAPRLTLSLRGEGVSRRQPRAAVRPERLDFGEVSPGEARELEVTVRNVGPGNLRLRGLTVVGAGFELGAEDCSGRNLGPSRTCSASVRFSPASRGDHEGRLEISSRDGDEGFVVPLRGAAAGGRDRPCARVRLGAFQGEEEDESRVRMKKLVSEGVLRVGECVTYTLKLEEPGNLYACVPSGYSFGAEGFERMRGEQCRVRGDETRYQKYRRPDIRGGTVLDDLTLTRGEGSARDFRLILRFEGR